MSEVQFSFDALSFLQEVLPEPEEATPTDSIIRRPTEPKPVEAKDETQTMLQDFARLQADQYDLKSMKKAPPVKSNFIQEYLDSLDMFYKDEQMNEAINGALMEATRPPIGQLSETARTAIFSGMDMRGADKTMVNNAKEAQNVVQPMVTPVFRGRQPEMADSPALVDAPSIDTRSNEMLDKPKGMMNKPVGENSRADKLISQVFSLEGEYSTDKADTGNYLNGNTSGEFIGSNHGISADVLAKHLGKTPTAKDMRNLTKDTARDIYKNNYWDKFGMASLPEDLQPIVFNAVVNSQGHAVKVMQKLLGVEEDGVVGPKTREAMKSATFTKEQFKDSLLEKYKTFATWDEHGKGWTNRFTELAKG